MTRAIRPIAVCLFRDGHRTLLIDAFDHVKKEAFYRPIGGGIEFGESSEEALRRELREEVGAEVSELRYVGTLENIFVYNGERGHEIVQVYDGRFADRSIYGQPSVSGTESDGQPYRAVWVPWAQIERPLYPAGVLNLLSKL